MSLNNMDLFKSDKVVSSIGDTDLLTNEDKHLLNLRRKLIKLALEPRTKFDFNPHKQSNNLGIINFCKFCNVNPEEFIRIYLKNIQPFMIHEVDGRTDKSTDFSCILDATYSMPLWIEVRTTQFKEEIISFHELNWDNQLLLKNARLSNTILCIPNNIYDNYVEIGDISFFKFDIIRGFKSFELELPGKKISNSCVRVNTITYKNKLLDSINDNLATVLDPLVNLNLRDYPRFSRVNQISFTSYGDNIENNVSILLDLLYIDKKPSITAALSSLVQDLLKLPDNDLIIDSLISKFKSYYGIDYSDLFVRGLSDKDLIEK